MIRDLIVGEAELAAVSERHYPFNGKKDPCGPLRRLAAWYEQATEGAEDGRSGALLLAALRRLAEDRADVIVAQARARAARRMIELACDEENIESARKACFDLLKLAGTNRAAGPNVPAGSPPGEVAVDASAVRRALERLAGPAPAEGVPQPFESPEEADAATAGDTDVGLST